MAPRPRGRNGPFVASVAVMVSDRERSRAWYTQRLGLDVIDDDEHWLTVGRRGAGGRIHLCLGAELGEGFPLEPGNTGITLSVPGDPAASLARLRAAGVPLRPRSVPGASGWEGEVRDPDGNLLLLVAAAPAPRSRRPRSLLGAAPRPLPKA